jgi:hypothetical protein
VVRPLAWPVLSSRSMKIVWLSVALAACATPSSDDISGPFTGTPRRYAIDRIDLPVTSMQARSFADDLTGDGSPSIAPATSRCMPPTSSRAAGSRRRSKSLPTS